MGGIYIELEMWGPLNLVFIVWLGKVKAMENNSKMAS